jgi:hypothetical protein
MALLPGCASVTLQKSWKDPAVSSKQYRKLLVVGVADKPQMRQVFEEVFSDEIGKKGISGIPSYTLTRGDGKPTREAIVAAVKKSGADGVITTRLVNITENDQVRSGFVMTDRGLTDVYGIPVSYAVFVHQPVEVTMSTRMAMESNLFDAGTGLVVWSGTSSAMDPEGIITVSRAVADIVIKSMTKDGLL